MYSTQPRSYGLVKESAVTHPALHIRDVHDAHVVLEAVRLNILPLIKRRLLASERDELKSGHVYVWEEAQDDGGLLRWTDGRRWSQSRMRGDYLFYEEKIETTQEERDAKAARRARRASDPNANVPPPIRRKDRPSKPNGLTKQTYSVTVNLPGTTEPRKWHVVAYFSGEDYARLPVIENYAYLRNIHAPNGIFFSNKVLCSTTDRFASYSDESEPHEDVYHTGHIPTYPMSPAFSPPPSPLSSSVYSPRLSSQSSNSQNISLPPISSLGSYGKRPHLPHPHSSPVYPSHYTPLSSEDRRALQKLKVIL
ncbi:cAMP-independent regulatory protein pac2 [Psilocybe cubensis]|uniref:cAMP-independent regulatory protein pac2 n=2 Tax=Psilocybe cubensis TaxID=181762 RepID=A0A8H7XK22_PSICU|nr:cAMP-independent regulatory protein pac2 [Psilocybe cubensis]KAH9476524.1 cAMP-independent regulatory protein pac2 [Psilocybe cubensis]